MAVLSVIDPSLLHGGRDGIDERLVGERAWLSSLRVEEDGIGGTRVAAEFRPEGIALAFEQFALRWVEANRSAAWLLPSRHLALEAPERMLRAGRQREHGQNS